MATLTIETYALISLIILSLFAVTFAAIIEIITYSINGFVDFLYQGKYECSYCDAKTTKHDCLHCHGLGHYVESPYSKCDHASTVCTPCLVVEAFELEKYEDAKHTKNVLQLFSDKNQHST